MAQVPHYFGVLSNEHAVTLAGLPELPCPWCYRERGITFPRNTSSTICTVHAHQVEAQIEAVRARKRAHMLGKDSRHEEEHAQ